eukprot:7385781-Pyramimonas_sp.AAC.1
MAPCGHVMADGADEAGASSLMWRSGGWSQLLSNDPPRPMPGLAEKAKKLVPPGVVKKVECMLGPLMKLNSKVAPLKDKAMKHYHSKRGGLESSFK